MKSNIRYFCQPESETSETDNATIMAVDTTLWGLHQQLRRIREKTGTYLLMQRLQDHIRNVPS